MRNLDQPRELASKRAERKWRNHDIAERYNAEKKAKESAAITLKTAPDIAEVVTTERRKPSVVSRFQRKFARDIREMLEGHQERNILLWQIAQKARLIALKRALLKRQLAAEVLRERENSNA